MFHSECEAIVEDLLDGGGVIFKCGSGRSLGFIKGMECVAICDSLAGGMKEGAHFAIICASTRFSLLDALPCKGNIIPFTSCTRSGSSRGDIVGKTGISPSLQSRVGRVIEVREFHLLFVKVISEENLCGWLCG